MKRRLLVLFCLVVTLVTLVAIYFIQSPMFTRIAHNTLARYNPIDLGIDARFKTFSIMLFPPRVSIEYPEVTLKKDNILKLPEGTRISAESLELVFRPLQVFAGKILISEMVVNNGDVTVYLPKGKKESEKKKAAKLFSFRWDELFRIYAESISMNNTFVDMQFLGTDTRFRFMADQLRLSQYRAGDDIGYDGYAKLTLFKGDYPKGYSLPSEFEEAELTARMSRKGVEIVDGKLRTQSMNLGIKSLTDGNILEAGKLITRGEIRIDGDLSKLDTLLPASVLPDIDLEGQFNWNASFACDLRDPASTLKIAGALESGALQVDDWKIDGMKVEARIDSTVTPVTISVDSAKVWAAEVDRQAPTRPGHGGSVELKNIVYRWGVTENLSADIALKRAHVHWLGAPAVKDLFNLDTRITGDAKVDVALPTRGRALQVKARFDEALEPLILDNQSYGKKQKLNRIISVPRATISGEATIDDKGLEIEAAELKVSDQTVFNVGGTVRSGEYDLKAQGIVDLKNLGKLAETPIEGTGNLGVHVHGPSSRVYIDFSPDLSQAKYVNLEFGDLKGKITYDDRPSKLYFQGIQAQKNTLAYRGDGVIDFGDGKDDIFLDVKMQHGNFRDLNSIFSDLTKDLWWFPRTLSGQVRGAIEVRGKLALDQLSALGTIESSQLDWVEERFQSVRLKGGFDRGDYRIDEFRARKNDGMLNGSILLKSNYELQWRFRSSGLQLSDFDHIGRLDFPVRGKMQIQSDGSGKLGAIDSNTRIVSEAGTIRGRRLEPSFIDVKSSNGVLKINSVAFGGQGQFDLVYRFNEKQTSQLRLTANSFDFTPMILFLNPRLATDETLRARASGDLQLEFYAGKAERASGKAELDEFVMSKSDRKIALEKPVLFKIQDGTFDVRDFFVKSDRGTTELRLLSRLGNIQGSIRGDADLSAIEYATSAIESAKGLVSLDLLLKGTLKEPNVSGDVQIQKGTIKIADFDSPVEAIDSRIEIKGAHIQTKSMNAVLADGRLSGSGSVDLFIDRYPRVDLVGNLYGNKIKVYPFQFAKVRGKLKVTGDELPYLISGDVVVDQAFSNASLFGRKDQGLKAARYTPPPTSKQQSDFPRFKLDIDVRADRNVIMKNELLDAELKAKIKVINTISTPRLLGSAEILSGKINFKDRSFTIQSGTATFDNPTVINPRFTLGAFTQVNEYRIQMYVSGDAEKSWKVELSSNPALSESDIISLLALGVTQDDVKKLRSGSQQSLQQGQAASLVLNSLDFNRDVQAKTGLQIQVEEAINTQSGTSVFRPQNQVDTVAAPKIVIKRRIGKKLELSMGSTVGVGLGRQQQVNAEVKVTPSFSLIGVWNQFQGVDTNQNPTSYGLDLKLQKRFK